MSSASSAVTYTSVYTDFEPGRDEDEHELMFIQPHDPDFVPEPIYREYIPLEDEHILPAKEQPLPPIVSPTAESPGYVVESDPEEYEDDETEDGPVDHPMDGGDDDDDDSSGYDADDEDEDEEEGEEEEHLAPADSAVVIPIDELASPPEGTEPIIPPPSTDTATTGARTTIRSQTSISFPPEAEVERLLSMPTPSPSPLTSLSPPSAGERLARCTAPAVLPSPLLPPSLYLPPRPVLQGVDYGFSDTVEAEMRHRGIEEVGYGIRDTWIDLAEAVLEMAPTTLEKVNTRVTELAELHEHDTQDLYALLEDAQDGDSIDRGGGGLCCSRGLGSFGRVKPDITDSGDSLSNERHETRDGRHAGRVVSTTWAAEESWTARRERDCTGIQIMAPVTRQGQNPPPPNTNTPPHHMTPESVQAMIDQALMRNSTNGDGSQSSHEDNPRHIEKMESVFNISGCAIENQVKFATCTLLDAALTWWNGQIRTLGPETYAMTWEVLKKKITDKYCPQEELKKLEIELWNLKVKGNDVPTYTNRFQELTLICTKFVANENEKID
nr:reverse transcriptase domain-containing protein [Tanacetum cinerariifolium]